MADTADDSLTFGAAVELAVAMPLSWLPLISDYTREAKEPVKATAVSAVVYGIVSCFMYVIGMGASIFTGENDIAQILMKAGLGIAGLLIVVFSTVTTTFLDAYSAGISGESIVAKLKGKYAAVAVTVIGTVGAIVYPMDDITDFLYLIGSVFAPMIAVQIADFFLLKKKKEERAFDWCNLVIWLVGFVLYRILMHVDFALGNTLPDMVLTVLICLAVNAVKGKNERIKNERCSFLPERLAALFLCLLPVGHADGLDANASAPDHFNVVEFFFHQADHGIIFS